MAVQGDDKNKGIYHYVFSKLFLKHILILAATVLISIGLINVWLRFYTNHGQKIQVPDVINLHASEGQSTLLKSGLDFDINDSVFVVGQKGGIILNQNPAGGAFVKENRKLYVTITKKKELKYKE